MGPGKWPPNRGFISSSPDTLKPGMVIDRYGHEGGTFVAPVNTPFGQRALPADYVNQTPNLYELVKPINVNQYHALDNRAKAVI